MEYGKYHEKFYRNERVEMLSDGVFAIVLTLLVLELHTPELLHGDSSSEMIGYILSIKSKLISFTLSFIFIINLWFTHTVLFRILEKIDNVLLWLNNLFLLIICFIPFPTALIGEYPSNKVGMIIFGIPWVIIPVIFYIIGGYALKKKYFVPMVDKKRLMEVRRSTLLYIPVVLVNLAITLYSPQLAFFIYMLLLAGGIVLGFRVRLIKNETD